MLKMLPMNLGFLIMILMLRCSQEITLDLEEVVLEDLELI